MIRYLHRLSPIYTFRPVFLHEKKEKKKKRKKGGDRRECRDDEREKGHTTRHIIRGQRQRQRQIQSQPVTVTVTVTLTVTVTSYVTGNAAVDQLRDMRLVNLRLVKIV